MCTSYSMLLLRAPFRDEWRGLLGLAARRSHADKRIPSAPRSSSLGPHSGQHAAVLRPEDFPLRSLPVLSSAAGKISRRRRARRSRPLLSGRRDVFLCRRRARRSRPLLSRQPSWQAPVVVVLSAASQAGRREGAAREGKARTPVVVVLSAASQAGRRLSAASQAGRRDGTTEHDDRPQSLPSPPHPRLLLLLSRSL